MLLNTQTKFTFFLSEESQKRHFLETGQKGPTSGTVELDLTQLTPEQRQKLLDYTAFTNKSNFHSWERDFLTFNIAERFTGGPYLNTNHITFDTPPTVADVFAHIDRMMTEYPAIQAELQTRKVEFEAKRKQEIADRIERSLKESAERDRERLEAAIIPWKDDGTAIVDLETAIFAASLDKQDKGGWILEVSGINRDDKYKMFVGEYVEKGTVEVTRQRRVYLVASKSGSRKYQTTTYRVVLMTDLGVLERTDITTDDDKPGWQLRIRDQVAELLV